MTKLTHNQISALKNANLNGELTLIMSNCWSTRSGIGGSWASVTINKLVKLGMLNRVGEERVIITEAGRTAIGKPTTEDEIGCEECREGSRTLIDGVCQVCDADWGDVK